MTIENIYTLKIETKLGPRYLVVAQAHLFLGLRLKNDKYIPFFSIKTNDELNPYGFATLDEISDYYGGSRNEYGREQEKFRNKFTRKTSFYGNNRKAMGFYDICVRVLESLEKPITPEALFGCSPLLNASFKIGEKFENHEGISLDMAIEIFQNCPKGTIIDSLTFNSPLVTKKQRREMERSYYVIKVRKPIGTDSFFKSIEKSSVYFEDLKYRAKQFRTENEVFAFIEKNEFYFGRNGYEILEIEGMTLEKGLSVENIPTF